jgi:hypothetical protein
MRYHSVHTLSLLLCCAIACLFFGCSNSEGIDYAEWDENSFAKTSNNDIEEYNNSSIVQPSEESDIFSSTKAINHLSASSEKSEPSSSSKNIDKLPLDDTEYPYAGIPRIVIETEGHREIKDRETEIPAKLQIWGEKAPESEIMDLTIRGRGNSTWGYPKKPYAIKFNEKQTFLGMPKAQKWVMLANYRDRTLIRNALAFEIARQTSQAWVPQGKFADVYLNNEFIGNYYICEKIEAKKNRLELDENGFLLEFDKNFDETNKFKSSYKNFPINIKYPKEITTKQFDYIRNYVNSAECILYGDCPPKNIQEYINLQSAASFWIISEIAKNEESIHPKSVFVYKDSTLNFGPVWDFDWHTFCNSPKGLRNGQNLWYDALNKNVEFITIVKNEWNSYKANLYNLSNFIDSISTYIKKSNEVNISLWPIDIPTYRCGDEDEDFNTAFQMIKEAYLNRINELDGIFNQ